MWTKVWWKAALNRAFRTAVQSLAPSLPASIVISTRVDWFGAGLVVASVIGTALLMGLGSILTSILSTPPEVKCQ